MFDDSSDNPIAVPPTLSGLLEPLKLKLVSHRSVMGQFYLATEDGRILPGQMSVDIESSMNEATTITVQFVVDNKNIWIEE